MNTTPELASALIRLRGLRNPEQAAYNLITGLASDTMNDIGPNLTCPEAEGLASALVFAGAPDLAIYLIASHAAGDDDLDDRHGHLMGGGNLNGLDLALGWLAETMLEEI